MSEFAKFTHVHSRAIAIYLCEKYESKEKGNKLYPSDPLGKAKVNKAIFADLDNYFKILTYAVSGNKISDLLQRNSYTQYY